MLTNFKGIKTTRNRPYDDKMISRINDSLSYLSPRKRSYILGTIIEESQGNPLATSASGKYQGLLQWGPDRYQIQSQDKEKELTRQMQLKIHNINDTTDRTNWTHGGENSGYKSFREAYNDYNNPYVPFGQGYRAFSYGYVRPQGKDDSVENRLKVVLQVYDRIKNADRPAPKVVHTELPDATRVARPILAVPTYYAGELPEVVVTGKRKQGLGGAINAKYCYANGGKKSSGHYWPSEKIRNEIREWEGSSMKTNRTFGAEARDFNRVIPASIRSRLTQQQLDALYSYGYNVGMGNLKERVLPTLTNYVNGRTGAEDVASSMWASKDPLMRGLQRRRQHERNMFINDAPLDRTQSVVDKAINMDLSYLPSEIEQSAAFMDALPDNPTDYGQPVDYSTLMRDRDTPAAEEYTYTDDDDSRDKVLSALRTFGLMGRHADAQLPAVEQEDNSTAFFSMPAREKSSASLSGPIWELAQSYANGGHLLGDGGSRSNGIYMKDEDHYYTDNGDPVQFLGWNDEGRKKFRNTRTGETALAFAPSDNYGITAQDYKKAAKNYRSSYDPNGAADFMNIATLGIGNRLAPSQNIGLIRDAASGRINSMDDLAQSALIGNDGTGIPSLDTVLDIAVPMGIAYGPKVPKIAGNIERRGIETFMRTTSFYDPLPEAKENIKSMFHGQYGGKKRLGRIVTYILTGHKVGPKGYYNSFAHFDPLNEADLVTHPTWAQRWERFMHPKGISDAYSGIFSNSMMGTGMPDRNDLIDAFLYRKPIDPSFGMKLESTGSGFGPHADYVAKNYAKKAKDIPVYNTGTLERYPEASVTSSGGWKSAENGIFLTGNNEDAVNAAGHIFTEGTASDGTQLVKQQDIWKFKPDEYFSKWIEKTKNSRGQKRLNPLKAALYKIAIGEVDRFGTPVITKTKWIPKNVAIMEVE